MSAGFLGFDYGTRRIGVASGEAITGSARPLTTLPVHASEPSWKAVRQLLHEWRPQALVVGLPLALDGSQQPMTGRARRFAEALGRESGLPVHLHDERHSSQEAARRFAAARARGQLRRRDAGALDAMAAAVILESWLLEQQAEQRA